MLYKGYSNLLIHSNPVDLGLQEFSKNGNDQKRLKSTCFSKLLFISFFFWLRGEGIMTFWGKLHRHSCHRAAKNPNFRQGILGVAGARAVKEQAMLTGHFALVGVHTMHLNQVQNLGWACFFPCNLKFAKNMAVFRVSQEQYMETEKTEPRLEKQ